MLRQLGCVSRNGSAFVCSIWFGWVVQLVIQCLVQPSILPGLVSVREPPELIAFCFGMNFMPAYLDSKSRSLSPCIRPDYYAEGTNDGDDNHDEHPRVHVRSKIVERAPDRSPSFSENESERWTVFLKKSATLQLTKNMVLHNDMRFVARPIYTCVIHYFILLFSYHISEKRGEKCHIQAVAATVFFILWWDILLVWFFVKSARDRLPYNNDESHHQNSCGNIYENPRKSAIHVAHSSIIQCSQF